MCYFDFTLLGLELESYNGPFNLNKSSANGYNSSSRRRTHNLKNIDLDIPRDKLIVITGLSGSGKSSLAFDTLYAEGQRRYVESLSTYARQFLAMMEKPDIDHIEGLSPAISIEQKSTSHNPRSTVGTITEIYDYLRLLFARAGEPRCPDHHLPLKAQTVSQMVDQVLELPEGTKLMLLAPVVQDRKGEHIHLLDNLRRQGFIRARIDGLICDLDEAPALDKKKKHSIEVVVDRFKVKEGIGIRMAESFETALGLSEGIALISYMDGEEQDLMFSAKFACPICNYSLTELEPRLFSFNNPAGACKTCDGLGIHQFFDVDRIIQHPEASIAEGAIRGWDRRSLFYFNMLRSLAEHYDFDIESPWNKLSPLHQQKILFGSEEEEITFNYENDRGTVFRRQHSFEELYPIWSVVTGILRATRLERSLASIWRPLTALTAKARDCVNQRAMCLLMINASRISSLCLWASALNILNN